ncbi:MAG TPA: ACP phosphodiesterase [Puia sp.]|jgi:acyl carrier protein phosphodiesterase|nr:ACP phosphodiesterase [Puia sp.]
MNYLAHAYLSFQDPDILAGNMISDFIKGKKKFDYPDRIRMGITLHRKIDEYTDSHPATRQARQFLKTAAGLYAGSFVDIIYDHFLANDPYEFEEGALSDFTQKTYIQLELNEKWFPEKFKKFFFYMRMQNWLLNYGSIQGIHNSFEGLCRRAKYIDDPEPVFEAFIKYYEELKMAYEYFFPHVKTFAFNELLYLRANS